VPSGLRDGIDAHQDVSQTRTARVVELEDAPKSATAVERLTHRQALQYCAVSTGGPDPFDELADQAATNT